MKVKNIFNITNIFWYSKRYQATIINGKAIADKLLLNLRTEVAIFQSKYNRVPYLIAILVGENPASKLYVKNKKTAANFVGIKVDILQFSSDIDQKELTDRIHELNNNVELDSILLQLPLPAHINKNIYDEICPEKDVDGFTAVNFGKFCSGVEAFVPCTALAVCELLRETGINISGKNAVVCGRSKHVGLSIAMLLHSNFLDIGNATTTICHRYTPPEKLTTLCREADIVVSATGVPSLIRGHMIENGTIVIDVGISRIQDPVLSTGKVVGDVNFDEVVQKAGYLTPVPGGVGPMTVAMLLKNTLSAAHRRLKY